MTELDMIRGVSPGRAAEWITFRAPTRPPAVGRACIVLFDCAAFVWEVFAVPVFAFARLNAAARMRPDSTWSAAVVLRDEVPAALHALGLTPDTPQPGPAQEARP